MDWASLTGDVNTLGSIKRSINWSRVDSEGILDEAQKWIFARIRVRQMLSRADITIALDATTAALPTGYLDPIAFAIPGHINRLRYWDPERFQARLGWDTSAVLPVAPPTVWSDFDEVIQFNSKSDAAYTGKMVYFKQPTALSVSNTTNFLTSRYPTLLRRACLMFAAEERKDRTMMTEEETRCLAMLDDLKVESDLAMRGLEMDFHWGEDDGYY